MRVPKILTRVCVSVFLFLDFFLNLLLGKDLEKSEIILLRNEMRGEITELFFPNYVTQDSDFV